MPPSPELETVLPFPNQVAPVRHARSTVVIGSIASIRESGRFERYAASLVPEHRDELLHAVAGTWIRVEVARSHYSACDSLGLSSEQEVDLGRGIFKRTGDTMFGTVLRLAKGAGATPWTVLPQLQRFWDRGYDGGGVCVQKLGPKEARIELVQCSILESRYFRNAARGLVGSILQLFCTRVYMQELTAVRSAGSVAVRAQWV